MEYIIDIICNTMSRFIGATSRIFTSPTIHRIETFSPNPEDDNFRRVDIVVSSGIVENKFKNGFIKTVAEKGDEPPSAEKVPLNPLANECFIEISISEKHTPGCKHFRLSNDSNEFIGRLVCPFQGKEVFLPQQLNRADKATQKKGKSKKKHFKNIKMTPSSKSLSQPPAALVKPQPQTPPKKVHSHIKNTHSLRRTSFISDCEKVLKALSEINTHMSRNPDFENLLNASISNLGDIDFKRLCSKGSIIDSTSEKQVFNTYYNKW